MHAIRPTAMQIALAFAALFFVLALTYSLAVPIFEGPDEKLHYPYVKHLLDAGRLPVAGRDLLVKQAATQGPLYYLATALSTFWIDAGNMETLLNYNPHWLNSQYQGFPDNQNYIIRSPADRFPYQGAARAVHLSRVVAALFGALAVACTIGIAAELFPQQTWLAIGAGSLIAFNPQFVYVSANVSNDAPVTALVALSVLLALRWRSRLPDWRHSLALGVLAGLSILTKLNGIISCGLIILVWTLYKPKEKSYSSLLKPVLGLGLIVIIMSGWWFWRNWQLYGEWTATAIHLSLSQQGTLGLAGMVDLWPEFERTFWAAFGRGQIRVDEWIYRLLHWISLFSLLGLGVYIVRIPSKDALKGVIFLAAWIALQLILLVRWFSIIGSVSHARLLFPALPAIAILGMLGLGQWLPQRGRIRLLFSGGLSAGLLFFAIASLVLYILPVYTPPPEIERSEIPPELARMNLTYAHGLRLITAHMPEQAVQPGQLFFVDLFWEGVGRLDENYSVFVRLLDKEGAVIAAKDTYPGLGLLPTRDWPEGKLVRDRYPLTIPPEFGDVPQVAEIRAGLFDVRSETRAGLAAIDPGGQEVTPSIGRVKIVPAAWPDPQPSFPLAAQFGDQISLAGYDFACPATCDLTLYWQASGEPEFAYTVFIQHWANGDQVAGFDAPPRQGAYPSDWWARGEVIVDRHPLPALAGGHLRVGLYRLDTGERLPILSTEAPHQEHALLIEVPE